MATITEPHPDVGRPRRPPVPRAWKALGSLVAAGLLATGVYQIVVGLAHEEYTFERQFDAAGVTAIEVDNGADGTVRIVGSDTDTITVAARVSDGLRSTGHRERIDGDRLLLDSTCPIFGSSFCRVTYTIETPRDLDVVVREDNSGITVSDVTGDVDARSENGGLELARIGGSVTAHSDNGEVSARGLDASDVEASSDNGSVRLDFDRAPQRVVVDSDNGEVEVVLPQGDEAYNVETETDNGTMSMEVRTDPFGSRTIAATTDNGDVTVRYSGTS
jgi:hypothetical protein